MQLPTMDGGAEAVRRLSRAKVYVSGNDVACR